MAIFLPRKNHKSRAMSAPTINTDLNCLFKTARDPSRIASAISRIFSSPSGSFFTLLLKTSAKSIENIDVPIAKYSMVIIFKYSQNFKKIKKPVYSFLTILSTFLIKNKRRRNGCLYKKTLWRRARDMNIEEEKTKRKLSHFNVHIARTSVYKNLTPAKNYFQFPTIPSPETSPSEVASAMVSPERERMSIL